MTPGATSACSTGRSGSSGLTASPRSSPVRLFLVVVEDALSEYSGPEELAAELAAVFSDYGLRGSVKLVRRGGLLAQKVLEELPPVRHRAQGRYPGDRSA